MMRPGKKHSFWIWGLLLVLGGAAAGLQSFWWPGFSGWLDSVSKPQTSASGNTEDGHDHAHGTPVTSLELSPQARKNLGLTAEFLEPIQRQTYFRSLSIPAIVVERPGQSRLQISTPLTGIVTDVLVQAGETVTPGTPLFRIRLTHEDLVQSQTQFLQTLGERDVELREAERLQSLSDSGAVAGRLLLERQYALEKQNALLNAQREALRLHGLSVEQIQQVETSRKLLQELEIVALSPQDHDHDELHLSAVPFRPVSFTRSHLHEPELIVQNLRVHKGQTVLAGEMLCELADYSQLWIEGKAFEKDAEAILHAVQQNWPITATLETAAGRSSIPDLRFSHIGHAVDAVSRVLPFYVILPNRLEKDVTAESGKRFISWRYRVGQRLQLQVPVEQWDNQFVLPVEALARDGAAFYVYRENGKNFEQVEVHVKYRDQQFAVVADDGTLFPGDVIALRAAYQIWMAIRNQGGAAIDPHAGHNH